jgi:hypothetical protein
LDLSKPVVLQKGELVGIFMNTNIEESSIK